MEFTEGNQLWKKRGKHGRDYLFKTPEALWEAACGYFQWCDDNPVYKSVAGGPKYEPGICIPKTRAYTIAGLCVYLGCGSKYFNHFEAQLTGKKDEVSEEFLRIISLIRDVIFEQKYAAAAAGELNPSIIARELNLAYDGKLLYKLEMAAREPKREQTIIKWGDQEIPI